MSLFNKTGLVAWYPMTEGSGTTLNDYKGSNNGTLTNGPTWQKQKDGGYSIKFDGSNDYVSIGSNLGISGSDERSFSFWFKLGSTTMSDWTNVIGWLGSSSNDKYFDIEVDSSDNLCIHRYGTQTIIESLSNLGTAEWHHIVAIYDGSNWKVYLDKVEKVNESATVNTDGNFIIAHRPQYSAYFNGKIKNVLIFNRALSANEVKALYEKTYIE